MKPKDLVEASKELNALLFDAKKKEEGWIDTTGSNVKKMTKGIKEAAAIIEPDDTLTEETQAILREIDWSLDDYDEEDGARVQKNLQDMGIWLNEEPGGDDEPDADDAKEEKKAKKKAKKKAAAAEVDEDEPEVKKPKKAVKKAKKEKKGTTKSKTACICQAMAGVPKKGKTIDEVAEIADAEYVKAGGESNIKQTTHHTKVLIPAAVEWEVITLDGKTVFPVA